MNPPKNGVVRVNKTIAYVYNPILRTAEFDITDVNLRSDIRAGFEKVLSETSCQI